MALQLAPPRSHQRQAASLLIEAVLASAIAMTVLLMVVPIWNLYREHMRRARNIDVLESLVNKDINAFRQYATLWKLKSGPHSDVILNSGLTAVAAANLQLNRRSTSYESSSSCWTEGAVESGFLSDLGAYKTNFDTKPHLAPNTVPLNFYREFTQVPGYVLVREAESPNSFDPDNTDAKVFTVRLTYLLYKKDGTTLADDLPFRRTADVQVEAQYWC